MSNGADPSYISGDGYQALTLAQDIDVVNCLLDAGAKITADIATEITYDFFGSKQIKSLFEKRNIKIAWVDSIYQIYHRIAEYDDHSLYVDILKEAIPTIQNSLSQLDRYKNYDVNSVFCIDDEYEFYAINRMNELLLLNFQNETASHRSYFTLDQYKDFWLKIGLTLYESPKEFHPFFCEIYKVEECMDQASPKVINTRWPCLMFGDLLLSRASVSISANADRYHKKTAEESTLYWSHRRADRPCADLSHGWGGNSQWRTRFRFDYRSHEDLFYNVNSSDEVLEDDELSQAQQLELLKYRCFIKTPEVPDCFPYNYFATEKYNCI